MDNTIPTDRQVTYLCRDCLTTFVGHACAHPGDHYCEHCKNAMAEQMAIACVRQMTLEGMGFTPDEVEAEMRDWRSRRHQLYVEGP